MAGDGVVVYNYTTTFEGSSITFTCEDGLFPNDTIMATCTGEGHWSTDPATYMCINTVDTTTSSTTNTDNTDVINCLATCSTNPTTSPNPNKGISSKHNLHALSGSLYTYHGFMLILSIDTVNIATLYVVRFNSDSDHWCPVLHCWIGWWVSWWWSSCVLLCQVAE